MPGIPVFSSCSCLWWVVADQQLICRYDFSAKRKYFVNLRRISIQFSAKKNWAVGTSAAFIYQSRASRGSHVEAFKLLLQEIALRRESLKTFFSEKKLIFFENFSCIVLLRFFNRLEVILLAKLSFWEIHVDFPLIENSAQIHVDPIRFYSNRTYAFN